ncbi:DoxX-like family protein [Paenibacillus eucommiae]|uniref:Membrane protein YphA (DoxX/SURF4 family) n=1 Tax=Paenibacillus eucommiae TaxID=1355755 RepID=A0ABS4ITY4_9BACL|nr:DoxX-like family protein [Paenibacillus eucommiae]MBP1990326.1 putative membrane protein YphA (DoxX/SURF4 family) [Paenibacillus eucommiae]
MLSAKRKPVYVECVIAADIDKIWNHTQTPEKHEQWDLRFTHITYLPRKSQQEPQQFHYETRIGFGISISGTGQTRASVEENDGARLSALAFSSEERMSLIRTGGGYWKYVPYVPCVPCVSPAPQEDQALTKFLTRYDYKTRWGLVGAWLDRLLFRPLITWATAWSFDCLRLWLERELSPRISTKLSLIYTSILAVLVFIWIWHGLVPKWLYPEAGEQQVLELLGLFPGQEKAALRVAGTAEILMGLVLLFGQRYRWLYGIMTVMLVVLGVSALVGVPILLKAPFNPLTFNLAVAACCLVNWVLHPYVPMASRCVMREPRAVSNTPGKKKEGTKDAFNL